MPGFDCLLAKSLVEIIRGNIGQTTLEKIEERLLGKYGITLSKAVEDFTELDAVLREFFGDSTESTERQFLQHIMKIKQTKKEGKECIAIEDRHLSKLILESFGDDDKKNIMNSVLDKPRVISDILKTSNIPQTSGYRKINGLIQEGFLIVNGYETTPDGKRVNKYEPIFENIEIQIEKNKVIVEVQLTNKSITNSKVMQLLRKKQQLVTAS